MVIPAVVSLTAMDYPIYFYNIRRLSLTRFMLRDGNWKICSEKEPEKIIKEIVLNCLVSGFLFFFLYFLGLSQGQGQIVPPPLCLACDVRRPGSRVVN